MERSTHLWAIVYDDAERASRAREQVEQLAFGPGNGAKYLVLLDLAVAVRNPDGTFTLERKPFPGVSNVLACTGVGFLVGLVLAAPMSGAAIGALVGTVGTTAAISQAGISEEFIRDVEALMGPGTSALFVLDNAADMEVVLHAIQGLGGTVVRTNVGPQRAKLIQSTLAGK
jgi:uncharacterized membrane protein